MITKNHHYFLLSPRPWPLILRFQSFLSFLSLLIFFKYSDWQNINFSLILIVSSALFWWFSFRGEMNLEGKNSLNLERGIKFSIILFIFSEVFFFFSFFWSYFHFFLSPSLELGLIFPPEGVLGFDCLNVPLINTLVLISSGVTVTLSHNFLIQNYNKSFSLNLFLTVVLGILFTILQGMEYNSSFFTLGDRRFGTIFFVLTGFHGIHVIIGSLYLAMRLVRSLRITGSKENFIRFEIASWYWHFVDVVWIFLYFFIYYINE